MATVIRYDKCGLPSDPTTQEWITLIRWPITCQARIFAKGNIFDGFEAKE